MASFPILLVLDIFAWIVLVVLAEHGRLITLGTTKAKFQSTSDLEDEH
jgi:hypothetical protein